MGSCSDVGHGSCREDGFCVRSRPIGGSASSARIKRASEKASWPATRHTPPPRSIDQARCRCRARRWCSKGRRSAPAVGNGPPGFSAWGDAFNDPGTETVCLDIADAAGLPVFRTRHSHGQEQDLCRRVVVRPIRGGARVSYLAGETLLNEPAETLGISVPLHRPRRRGPTDCRPGPAGRADRPGAGLIHRSAPRQPAHSASLVASKLTDVPAKPSEGRAGWSSRSSPAGELVPRAQDQPRPPATMRSGAARCGLLARRRVLQHQRRIRSAGGGLAPGQNATSPVVPRERRRIKR